MSRTTLTFVVHAASSPFVFLGTNPFLHRTAPASTTRAYKRRRARAVTTRLCSDSSNPNGSSTSSTAPDPISRPATPSTTTSNGTPRATPGLDDLSSRKKERASSAGLTQPHAQDSRQQSGPPPNTPQPNTTSISLGPLSFSIPARWLLYVVPFFWGSFGPAVRLLFAQDPHPDPSVFNTERLFLSTLVYAPVIATELTAFRNRGSPSAEPSKSFAFIGAGTELGIYVFLANVAQVLGLQQTSASRAAFLVQLQTVFVPVLSGLFGVDKVSRKTWLSSLVAVGGVALLSSDKGHGTVSSLTGDALEVLSALFFSTYIIRLSKYCNDVPANPLVATKILVQTVLSLAWAASAEFGAFFHHTPTDLSAGADEAVPWTLVAVLVNVAVVMWTGLLSSAASGWAQTKGQQGVPASEAVVIFATQPLWASALAAVVLGESFGPKGFAGGALIIAATLIAGKSSDEDVSKKER